MGFSAAAVIGAAASATASHDAAVAQETAGNKAIAYQQQSLAQQMALEEPYRKAGASALDQLLSGMQPGGQFAKPFSMAESPAQQFATKEALAAMQNQMAVGGQGLSSNAIVGAGQTAANIGSQYEQQAYNQWLTSQQQAMQPLEYMANLGQAAASGQASNIGSAASNITGLQTGIGNVQAAGAMAGGNALAGLGGNVSQYLMLQSLLGKGGTSPGTNAPSPYGAGNEWMSDPRIKQNIKFAGKTVHDLNLYEFNYIGDDKTYRGVMSDEVEEIMPEAVIKHGLFDKVNYKILGIQMEQV
jgi:hypothetical protein